MKSLKEVLQEMKALDKDGKAVPFSLQYVTYDKKKKRGGDLMEYDEAIICKQNTQPGQKADSSKQGRARTRKDPNHKANHTINIQIMNNGILTDMVRKVHLPLITRFNGEKITL